MITSSARRLPAAAWASGASSGRKTSCSSPVRSRRSMKISPPWSRRRCTQPATRTSLAHVVLAQLAGPVGAVAVGARGLHAPTIPRTSSTRLSRAAGRPCPCPSPRSRLRRITVQRAPSRSACFSWPFSDRPACSIWARRPLLRSCRDERERVTTGRRATNTSTPRSLFGRPGRQQDALDAGRPADAGRRRAAELLDQAVVAPAAAERRLRAEPLGLELEHRARVVVEPAHERRVDLVRRARRRRGARAPRRSARRRPAPSRSSRRGASFITACVPGWSASKARSGFWSSRARTSSDSSASRARR